MALIELGPMVSGIKGSIGGTTYAKTRYGYIAKQKAQPVNPSSAKQTDVRSWMTQAVSLWKGTLTNAEILSWIHGAQLHKRSHIGVGFELSGINLFCACYVALKKAGETPPTECTIFDGAPEINLPVIGKETVTGKLEIRSVGFDEENFRQLLYASNGVSIGINYKSVPFVWNVVLDSTFEVITLVDVLYPGAGMPYRVFFGCRVVDIRGAISGLLKFPVWQTMV